MWNKVEKEKYGKMYFEIRSYFFHYFIIFIEYLFMDLWTLNQIKCSNLSMSNHLLVNLLQIHTDFVFKIIWRNKNCEKLLKFIRWRLLIGEKFLHRLNYNFFLNGILFNWMKYNFSKIEISKESSLLKDIIISRNIFV